MKKDLLLLLSLFFVILSCQKDEDPYVSINQTDVTINDIGGSQSISFESNVNWTAKSSAGWCSVSPSSGNAGPSSTTITVTPTIRMMLEAVV